MKHVLIPIAGFARAGKDSLADAIFDHLEVVEPEYSVIILKFADELKSDLEKSMDAVGVKVDVWTEDTQKKKALRPLLVAYGEYRRSLDPDVWVNKVIKEIKVWTEVTVPNSESKGSLILVPDMRYANEYEKLRDLASAKGWAFVPIYIERQFNLPANEAEAESIAQMAAKGYFTSGNALQLSFSDKSVEAIQQWAKKFAQSMSVYR
jgi:hypothetical protein